MARRLWLVVRACVPLIAVGIILAWFANLLWYEGEVSRFGGSPASARGGHFYLMSEGISSEVSRALWERMRLQRASIFPGAVLALLCFGYLVVFHAVPFFAGVRQGPAVADRVRAVRASGSLLTSRRFFGSIAGANLGFPVIVVEVFPGGITVRLPGKPPVAVLRAEVRGVDWWPKGRRVTINYVSPDVQGPLVLNDLYLYGQRARELRAALAELTDPQA